ncbi:MAG TPA: glycosyltransferase [Vicinamibacterales bacterium]|nr:glycosyltransferase [Vicinamibacterales bacterium]
MIVNQWVPSAHYGDAIGDHIRATRDVLRGWGHQSDVFAAEIDDELEDEIRPWTDRDAGAGDVTLLHFAGASPMTSAFPRVRGRRVLVYHNITPARFFADYEPGLARGCAEGRKELATLSGSVDLAIGDSEFNRRELESVGFRSTAVVPILVNTDRLLTAPRLPALESQLQDGLTNILFVGRIAPNKKIEDHIRLAEHYKRYVDAYYRFIFVGRQDASPRYYTAIRALVAEYRMLPERFLFPGQVSEAELAAYYRNAHAYVSLSEHEGFCVPLVEAMTMDVPVLAYDAGAVGETMGGAGITFSPKDLEQAAEWLGALIYDHPLRESVVAGQRRRVPAFERTAVEPRLRHMLETVTQ